jgi:hypothetical protein
MTERKAQLAAYLATLATLAFVFVAALIAAAIAPALIGKLGSFGLGAITGGLIGVLRLPQQRGAGGDNAPDDPAPARKGSA